MNNISDKLPVVSGENSGNPFENFGECNFIQVYVEDKPYFRAGLKSHKELLEDFLKEANIEKEDFLKRVKRQEFFSENPNVKKYGVVGEGVIQEAYDIRENMNELGGQIYYAVRSGKTKLPSIEHFSKILKHFKEPLIFIGSNYWTEEEKGFMAGYGDLMHCPEQEISLDDIESTF